MTCFSVDPDSNNITRAGTIVGERWRNWVKCSRFQSCRWELRNCNSVAFKWSFCGDRYRFDYSTAVFTVLSARGRARNSGMKREKQVRWLVAHGRGHLFSARRRRFSKGFWVNRTNQTKLACRYSFLLSPLTYRIFPMLPLSRGELSFVWLVRRLTNSA